MIQQAARETQKNMSCENAYTNIYSIYSINIMLIQIYRFHNNAAVNLIPRQT